MTFEGEGTMSNYTEYLTKGGQRLLVKSLPRQTVAKFFAQLPGLPKAPTKTLTIAEGATTVVEDRESPDYQAALKAALDRQKELIGEWTIHMGVRLPKEDRAAAIDEVRDLRERLASSGSDQRLHPDDETAYLIEYVLEDVGDVQAVTQIIFQRARVNQEEVASHVDTFRGDVPGSAAGPDPDAEG